MRLSYLRLLLCVVHLQRITALAFNSNTLRNGSKILRAADTTSFPSSSLHHHQGRRQWLAQFLGACTVPWILPTPALAHNIVKNPLPESIYTVVLESPFASRLGIQLMDVTIGGNNNNNQVVAAVKSTEPGGLGASNGLQEGMIALGKKSTSKDIVHQIKNGPYPIVLQFYSLAKEMEAPTAAEGLKRFQEKHKDTTTTSSSSSSLASNINMGRGGGGNEPALSFSGAGLGTKTIRKGENCKYKVKRGDTVKVLYEARVASPGGPIYDSTDHRGGPVTFTLGDGKTINGVEIGIGGMCPGEIRDLDIPSPLGYGRFGSQYYDIPGDVRLWWRIQLLELTPNDMKFR